MATPTPPLSVTPESYPDASERAAEFLARGTLAGHGGRVVPLTGDASDRKYFRVLVPDESSFVLAVYAAPFEYASLSFVNVAELLQRMPVPIPSILGHAGDLGVLALQDLGDVTLQAHLGTASHNDHMALYRQAVSVIATLQHRGGELACTQYVPYGIAFDVEKLTWEMDFFTKHFLEAYRGASLTPGTRAALHQELVRIVEELAAERRVLCHRDYHSRNLMLHSGQLFVIDFQDARLGPDTYDLVSLLRDAYVDLAEEEVSDLIAHFLALTNDGMGEAQFRPRFDLMSLQRNLKALGTFGYQTIVRENPVYIQYIPRTIRHVQKNLERYPRFGRLRDLLAVHVEELR